MVKPITNPTADAALNVRLLNNLSEMIGSTTFSSTKQNARSRIRLARPRPIIVEDVHADCVPPQVSSRIRQTTPAESRDIPHQSILWTDRKSTRLNSSHLGISYAVFCL